MSSSGNLAQLFAQSQSQIQNTPSSGLRRSKNHGSHSKAIHAEDDQHFEDTSFLLKRTRSVGLLDEFIAPTKKLIEEDQIKQGSSLTLDADVDDDEGDNQFIENVADIPANLTKKNTNILYTYDDNEENTSNDFNDNNTRQENNDHISDGSSPSPSGTPDIYQPHDDNDIVYEPSRHVDYLSHNWKEADISKSWRYIVLKRKDVANSARLENASWRTWAQAKYHLKTISPESVNWLKDSDVTWLYGPLYKEPSHGGLSASFDDLTKKYGSDNETSTVTIQAKMKKLQSLKKGPKPILKKRTVSEMLTQPSTIRLPPSHHTHHLPSPPLVEDDFDLISRKVNAQYSNTNLKGALQSQPLKPSSSTESEKIDSPKSRHIHFNDRVEQCIALNYPTPDEDYDAEYDNESGEDEEDDGSDSDDDEGGFFLMVKSPSSAQLHNKDLQSLSSKDSSDEKLDSNSQSIESDPSLTRSTTRYQTIELLPSTTLKHGSDEEIDNFAMSHNTNTSRGYDYHYDYNSVFTGNDSTVHIGSNDYEYEDTPQHLEGVSLVDVPENIVLGSNFEIAETPQFIEAPLQNLSVESFKSTSSGYTSASSQPRKGFALHSDSDSESEEEQGIEIGGRVSSPLSSNSSIKNNYGDNLTRVSPSPSYASLSDVAAQGYISPSSTSNSNLSDVISGFNNNNNNNNSPNSTSNSNNVGGDVQDLQKDIGVLNVDEEPKGFRSNFMNSWKKHT